MARGDQGASSFWSSQAPLTVQLLVWSVVAAVTMTFGVAEAMTSLNWTVIFAFGLTTAGMVWVVIAMSLWKLWLFWIPKPDQPAGQVLGRFVAAMLLLTSVFGVITALTQTPYASGRSANLEEIYRADFHYLWHFLDAIPLLKIPQTLNWSDPLPLTTYAAGAALLTYQLLIVLPVVSTTTALIKRAPGRSREVAEANRTGNVWLAFVLDRLPVVIEHTGTFNTALAGGLVAESKVALEALIVAVAALDSALADPGAPESLQAEIQQYRDSVQQFRATAQTHAGEHFSISEALETFPPAIGELIAANIRFVNAF